MFLPVLHGVEVYLPCLSARKPSLESFNLSTEQFRTLPHALHTQDLSPTVAFMEGDKTLVILSQNGCYYVLRMNNPQLVTGGSYRHDDIEICAPAPVIYYRKQAYFRGKYNVLSFSLEEQRLRIVGDFTEKQVR
jgi:hypothetical protein